MIKNSFIFLKGISSRKEQNLWKSGIKNWDDFLEKDKIKSISKEKKEIYNNEILNAKKLLLGENNEFILKFPSNENWRLYEYFKNECIYLDIEIGKNYKDIILIGLFDRINTKTMVKNYNLYKENFLNEIKNYKLIISYNGSALDIPAIEKYFGIKINIPHIDLKHSCQRLGLKNGLKEIERNLGIKRPENLYGRPYNAYKAFLASGDKEYLELLIKYNEEDIINLKPIMEYCYNKLKEKIYISF